MKYFYEDTKKVKIVAKILLTLGLIGLVSIFISVIALEILKISTLKVKVLDKVISISCILFIIIVSGYILKKADLSYFIEVTEGRLKLRIRGAIYVYNINDIEECYVKKVSKIRIHKKIIIKVSKSIFEITTRKPEKLIEAIESWKVKEITLENKSETSFT
ncbi:MAG: hypothetical protein GX931_00590 [Acholeplasmataceae bacterium]|nr:hypothetical protein [Acholeplasmataceae bacterium]